MYCVKCGDAVHENSFFCSKCGVRTKKGYEEKVALPKEQQQEWEFELEQALSRAGNEIEKTLSIAAEEFEKAIKKTKERIRKRNQMNIVCPECKKENYPNANFCFDCGNKLN